MNYNRFEIRKLADAPSAAECAADEGHRYGDPIPCHICGGTPRPSAGLTSYSMYEMMCDDCYTGDRGDVCGSGPNEADAIQDWNDRTEDAAEMADAS